MLFAERHEPQPIPRKILVLYGKPGGVDAGGKGYWPADTWTARHLQTPAEYLGYEAEYWHASDQAPPTKFDYKQFKAIVIDPDLVFSNSLEDAYTQWLIRQKNESLQAIKLLFFSRIPFVDPTNRSYLFKDLGITKTGNSLTSLSKVTKVNDINQELFQFEASEQFPKRLQKGLFHFPLIQAPPTAHVHLSLIVKNKASNKESISDSVFVAPWGLMALDPCVLMLRPDYTSLWLMDPFQLLQDCLGPSHFPIPDTTTFAGLRMFCSHIDGDGFSNRSEITIGKYAAEIIRDRILKKYPVPISVSIIESEIRGMIQGQLPREKVELPEVARSIFQLPNIQVASHTFAHPYYWMDHDKSKLYPTRYVNLSDPYPDPDPEKRTGIDYEREIIGSINYINTQLAPADKKCEILLWSGNCRPGPHALSVIHSLELAQMNGGDTIISRRHPTITTIAPRTMQWNNEIQVYTPIQNEMLFTNGFKGPFYGGFVNVLQTFELTEFPRRIKPVCIYYHFFCGDKQESVVALEKLYDWVCNEQHHNLHSVTSAQYAHLATDARRTAIHQLGKNHFHIKNKGRLRTFRLPNNLWPDLHLSKGILGFNEVRDQIYIFTDDSGDVELVLSPSPTLHPYLISSTGSINFSNFSEHNISFSTKDFRPVKVIFGGFRPNITLGIRANQRESTVSTDDLGKIELDLDSEADVMIFLSSENE